MIKQTNFKAFKPLLAASAVAVAALTATPASAAGPASTVVSLSAPAVYSANVPFVASGYLTARVGSGTALDSSQPLPNQTVSVLVDGMRAASATTSSTGRFQVSLVFDGGLPHAHDIQAVAYAGTPLQATSATRSPHVDHYVTSIAVTPAPLSLVAGADVQMTAIATYSDGVKLDVTDPANWESSDYNVVDVTNDPGFSGDVYGVDPGTATIMVTMDDVEGDATVTVTP